MSRYDGHIDIHLLIERYFAGETSLEEERLLKRMLASTSESSPDVEEAGAVMGFIVADGRRHGEGMPRRRWYLGAVEVAAAVAAVIGVGWGVARFAGSAPDVSEMLAYSGGERVDNPDDILRMVNEDFSCMIDANEYVSGSVSSDMDIFGEIINE